MHMKKRVWEILEVAKPGDRVSKVWDLFIISLICTNVIAMILGTVESISSTYHKPLYYFEIVSIVCFTIEYLLRVWSCTTEFHGSVKGRIRYVVTPMALIDLLAFLPFYLPFIGLDLRFIRLFRVMRIMRIMKIGRYSSAINIVTDALKRKKEELVFSIVIMLFLVVISASILYYCEHDAQPDVFKDIPTTFWWAIVTLSTVGYGDVYPVTALGRVFGGIIAMIGIGMFALPTSILGAGFIEVINSEKCSTKRCPKCGARLSISKNGKISITDKDE